MIRNALIVLAASSAIALPAAAQGQSGTQAPPAAAQASPIAQGPAAVPARTNSQGPANASATGMENANENSVLSTEDTTATVADSEVKAKKSDKTSKATVIKAGPNAGMVINKSKKTAPKDEKADAAAEAQADPQQ